MTAVRHGFTLLEVLVAIVVTSIVVSVAFGAAQAGLDVRERLDRAHRDEAGAIAVRELLHDALRHAERGAAAEDTTFALGAGGDLLRVVTRGVRPPLGTGGRWAVSLATVNGVVALRAVPLDGTPGAPLRLVARAVAGAEVRALDGGAWRDAWDRPDAPPPAVSVRLVDARGRDVVPALVARTRPEGSAEDAP